MSFTCNAELPKASGDSLLCVLSTTLKLLGASYKPLRDAQEGVSVHMSILGSTARQIP